MSTIKHKLSGILAIFCLMTLTACNISSTDSEISDINKSNSISSEIQNTPDNNTDMVMKLYNVELPIVSADEALQITKVNLPEQIEGHFFNINQLIDDKNLVVSLFDREGASGIDFGTGIYDIESNKYRALPGLPNDGYCTYNSNYIVYKEYNDDFTIPSNDNSVKLYLYDVNAQQKKLIYVYSFDRDVELYGGHWKNTISLSDDKVYFDDYVSMLSPGNGSDSEWLVTLYSYDIKSGKIEKLKDDAQCPMTYKDTLLYIKQENDQLRLQSLNGEYELEMKGNYEGFAPLKNDVFSLEALSSDDTKHETTWGIKNMFTNVYILKTTRTISNLVCGDIFMAFTDYGTNYPPIIYNAKNNNFIVFDDLIGENVTWYFCNDVGMVCTNGEESVTYVFKLK